MAKVEQFVALRQVDEILSPLLELRNVRAAEAQAPNIT